MHVVKQSRSVCKNKDKNTCDAWVGNQHDSGAWATSMSVKVSLLKQLAGSKSFMGISMYNL